MTQAFVGIGSNIDRDNAVRAAVTRLHGVYGPLLMSSVYESPAYGFEGENFYNLVVAFETTKAPLSLTEELHTIESELGRERDQPRYSSRILDLDLLLYGDLICHGEGLDVPRKDIRKFAFVLKPLAEIAGEMRHPETGDTFADMWKAFNQADQTLWPVEMEKL